jgi:hypothetical protein
MKWILFDKNKGKDHESSLVMTEDEILDEFRNALGLSFSDLDKGTVQELADHYFNGKGKVEKS